MNQLGLTLERPSEPAGKLQEPRKTRERLPANTPSYRYTGGQEWKLGVGTSRCVCMGCGDGFNSVSSFDMHQRLNVEGRVVCLDPETLGMERNASGWWVRELRAMDEQGPRERPATRQRDEGVAA